MQHFWLHGKSFVSPTGLKPVSHLCDAALLFRQDGASKHHWWQNTSLRVLQSLFQVGLELSGLWM